MAKRATVNVTISMNNRPLASADVTVLTVQSLRRLPWSRFPIHSTRFHRNHESSSMARSHLPNTQFARLICLRLLKQSKSPLVMIVSVQTLACAWSAIVDRGHCKETHWTRHSLSERNKQHTKDTFSFVICDRVCVTHWVIPNAINCQHKAVLRLKQQWPFAKFAFSLKWAKSQ